MLKIQPDRVKIDFYEAGIAITIKERNMTIIKEYSTPCFVKYKERLIELHKDCAIDHSTPDFNKYVGDDFKRILPSLLEHGNMLEKN